MWGSAEQQLLGRLPHAMRLAMAEQPAVVVFGTGSSERDGVLEGDYIVQHLMRY
jgi:hypothetical protein